MSFSLFSEKRPWGESSTRVGVNKWSAPADTWTPVGGLARHTHVLRYCMQNSTVGYVGVESEHRICKVAIWEENVREWEDHKSFQILQTHSRLGDAKLWLTGRRCQEFEMQALHLFVHGHAQKAPSLSPLRRRHFHTDVPVAWRADTVQETGEERVPVQTHGHSTTHLNVSQTSTLRAASSEPSIRKKLSANMWHKQAGKWVIEWIKYWKMSNKWVWNTKHPQCHWIKWRKWNARVPFCGGKPPNLTSDELHGEHLRVFCVTDQSKYLQGDEQRV